MKTRLKSLGLFLSDANFFLPAFDLKQNFTDTMYFSYFIYIYTCTLDAILPKLQFSKKWPE
jgi:hypothetical protein